MTAYYHPVLTSSGSLLHTHTPTHKEIITQDLLSILSLAPPLFSSSSLPFHPYPRYAQLPFYLEPSFLQTVARLGFRFELQGKLQNLRKKIIIEVVPAFWSGLTGQASHQYSQISAEFIHISLDHVS
ncbi:hypothetical protein ATANTOWER_021998 [Ataeniobius toweri]|uniref:Uncharacterized protein n=1 Tax=Ataeniobius toweri TaxID=208326 RepID=A0ABU7BRC1_9TELE|nr:hypothetical protein [Ataeniobius toweri]